MRLSFATLGCPSWSLEQVAQNAANMGFDGVELRGEAGEHIGPDETPEDRARIRSLFGDRKLEIPSIMGYSRFTWTDAAKRQEDIDTAVKFLAVAKDVGCPLLRVFCGTYVEGGLEENVPRVVEGLRQLAPHAEEIGVQIAIETHDDWCKGENIRRVLDGVDSPAVGICWDISNASFSEPLEETFQYIRGRILHVHFKDAARAEDGKIHSQLPGTGEVDMRKGLTLLHEGGYDGFLSFEWEKKWEPDLEEPEVAFPHYLAYVAAMMNQVGVPRG
jgi:sugar phosphate isomerase/epimerase